MQCIGFACWVTFFAAIAVPFVVENLARTQTVPGPTGHDDAVTKQNKSKPCVKTPKKRASANPTSLPNRHQSQKLAKRG